jgi:hypothetical protein
LSDIAAQVAQDMGGLEAGIEIWLAPLEDSDDTDLMWDQILNNPILTTNKGSDNANDGINEPFRPI